MTPRISFFFCEKWVKELNPFLNTTHRIEFFFNKPQRIEFVFLIWLTELNPSFQYDSQNWTHFFNMTHRNWTFFFQHWLVEIEPTCFEHDSENGTHFEIWLKEMNHFVMCQWIELFSWTWLKELNFLNMTQRSKLFFNVTQRIEPLFLIRLEELNF